MMKGKAASAAMGLGIALGIFVLLEGLLALIMVKGLLPEGQDMLLVTAIMAVAAFVGSRFARRQGREAAVCAGALFVGLLLLTGFLVYDNIRPEGVLTAAVALASSVCGSAGGKKKRKNQRRSAHR